MIHPKVLKQCGYTPESLKKKFLAEDKSEGVKKFLDVTQARIHQGYNRTLRDARHYWAIDEAYDSVQQQISYTMVKGLLESKPSQAEVNRCVKDWGLTSMLSPMRNENGEPMTDSAGNAVMGLDLPTFHNIFVPVVLSYTKARAARIFTMRNQWPLYKYEPSYPSSENRARGRITTSRMQVMATQMGYAEDERQSILQSLMYSHCLAFPMEAYWKEMGYQIDDLGQMDEITVREGVRWTMPHPSRMFYDMSSRLSTLNYGTGVSHAGYWDVFRWSDVANNDAYWLKKSGEMTVMGGAMGWLDWDAYGLYRKLFPCTVNLPDALYNRHSSVDRTVEAFRYTMDTHDQGVTLVTQFQQIVPKEFGLFDYDEPLWMQTVNALEDSIIYAEPFCYDPVVAYQYDPDQNRYRNPSLAYELIPWQDHLGNLLTQYILSVKRNLTNVVLFNKEGVPASLMEKLENLGKRAYTDINFYGVSPMEQQWAGVRGNAELFQPITFPQSNTQENISAFQTVLQTMERVLGFTSAEVGAPASHQQSATEVTTVQNLASTRVDYTNSCLDPAFQKKKRVLNDAWMAYGSDDFAVEIIDMTQEEAEAAEDMGFEVETGNGATSGISGSKTKLSFEFWASDREGTKRGVDDKIASATLQLFQAIFSNPTFLQNYGMERTMRALNRILDYAGIPKELWFPTNEAVSSSDAMSARIREITEKMTSDQMAKLGTELQKRLPAMLSDASRNGAPAGTTQESPPPPSGGVEIPKVNPPTPIPTPGIPAPSGPPA